MDTTKKREVIGKCAFCNSASERYINCLNDDCHIHFIACEACEMAHQKDGKIYCPQGCALADVDTVKVMA